VKPNKVREFLPAVLKCALTVISTAAFAVTAAAQTNTFPTSGNAGIGTSSPGDALQIVRDNGGLTLDTSTSGTNVPVFKFSTTGTGRASIQFRPDMPGLSFQTGGIAYPAQTKMVLTDTGLLGVGTTTPDQYANIHISKGPNAGMDIQSSDTAGWARLRLRTSTRTYGWFAGDASQGDAPNKIGLYDYTASAFRMMIDSSGNVGIGNVSPSYKLDVAGQIRSSSGGFVFPDGTVQATAATGGGGSQWANASGGINYSAGNVAIGTTNPAALFDVRNSDGNFYAGFGYGGNKDTFLRAGNVTTGVMHIGDINTSKTLLQEGGGNVGIATSNPTEKLEVNGNIKVSGTGNITAAGTIEGGNIKAKYQDLAEWVPSSEQLDAGTVVVLDTTKSNQVVSSSTAYDTRVAGVISAQPGITLGESGEGKVLVATTGRVRVKVDASRGAIQIGDLLVTSDVTGVAMKSEAVNLGGVQIHRPGTIIGKALEPLTKGTGEILVLLSLQ
jgi:hypothetical protein